MNLDTEWAKLHQAAQRIRGERGIPEAFRRIGRKGAARPEVALARLKRKWAAREGEA